MPQLYEGGGGSEEDDAANPGVTDDDDLPLEEEEAKLPTLKDKVKKLKNNVPLGKNKNNAASEDDATDDDALFSQRGGHEEEDDSSSSSCCCSSGEEYDSDDEKPQEVVSKPKQETSTPIINAPQDYRESNVHPGNYSSEWQQKQQPHKVDESLKNLSLHPKKDQSCSNQEETHGNNLQEVEPESMGGATNTNCAAGGFTGLKSTVLGSAAAATASTVVSMFGYYSGGDHAGEKPSSGGGDQGGNTYNNQQATDHPAATGLKNDSVVGTKLCDTKNATTTAGEDDDETYIQKSHNTVVSSLCLDEPSDPLNAHLCLDKTKEYMTSTTDGAKSYTATATDIAYNTRDKVGSATTAPGQEKGVAHQVTESFSNLPTTLKESMFSPSSPTSNLASSAISSPRDVKTGAPGLVSHVTGAVSTLFSSKKLGRATTVDDSSLAALHENATIQQEATGRSLNEEEKNLPVTFIPTFHPNICGGTCVDGDW
ncbi:unnamed protein product [Sphagnum jensenii]|uniref:Uncharacterized protein n=1 Tax=Sphagnum jensenii TaxID=128206 RepID=A0ABP1A628_9BRYO